MAEADLLEEGRRLRRLQELVEDQRRRVAGLQENGESETVRRAMSLLAVLEQCLASAHYMLAAHRRGRGFEE